jgi:hypothetical protein
MNPKELRELIDCNSIVGKVSVVGDCILDEVGAMSAIDLADVATAWNALPALLAVYDAAEKYVSERSEPVPCIATCQARYDALKAALDAAREAK